MKPSFSKRKSFGYTNQEPRRNLFLLKLLSMMLMVREGGLTLICVLQIQSTKAAAPVNICFNIIHIVWEKDKVRVKEGQLCFSNFKFVCVRLLWRAEL